MRITILNLLYPPIVVGGAEKAANVLAEALVRQGNQVTVISLYPGDRESMETRNGVDVYRLPLDNLYWPFGQQKRPNTLARLRWHLADTWNRKSAKRVGRILDEVKPDVVHTHILSGFSVSVWKEIKRRNIRVVHTLHDYYLLCFHPGMFRNGRSCERRCADCVAATAVRKHWSNRIDAVVSVSKAVLATHRACGYFADVPGSVIYNIQECGQKGDDRAPLTVEREHGDLVFGFIGAIIERKGIDNLLKATALISGRNWRLRIAGVGDESYVAGLKSRFPDPRIEWLGFVSAENFYPSVDVVVVPSVWQDPLPYVVLETFAFGKSLICAQSGGLPELAALGKCVSTYPATDVAQLAGIMEQALANREQWRAGGFADERARDAFSEEAILQQYLSVYAG